MPLNSDLSEMGFSERCLKRMSDYELRRPLDSKRVFL